MQPCKRVFGFNTYSLIFLPEKLCVCAICSPNMLCSPVLTRGWVYVHNTVISFDRGMFSSKGLGFGWGVQWGWVWDDGAAPACHPRKPFFPPSSLDTFRCWLFHPPYHHRISLRYFFCDCPDHSVRIRGAVMPPSDCLIAPSDQQ